MKSKTNFGLFYALSAYFIWGIAPLFWKLIDKIPAIEILYHRMVWSFVILIIILTVRKHWAWTFSLFKNWRTLLIYLISSILLSLNWYTFIWAMNSAYIVEASLGYFINPLISVLMGVIFLKEKLRSGQWLAVAIAALGVLYLTFNYGSFPWIAITLATTFATYSLIRKTAALESLEGLSLEMSFLLIPALVQLFLLGKTGTSIFGPENWLQSILLICTGLVTVLPLLLFAAGVRKVTLSLVGLLQYVAPTLQFSIGVFVFKETFNQTRLIGFIIVWIALIVYTFESLIFQKKKV